jgi:selenocysteine lyase/cysteine desulfurase
MSGGLPDGFAALEPFVARWAVAGTAQRAELRRASVPEEREAFFTAAAPLLDRALDYLDGQSLAQLSVRDERLMNLMLSLAHVAMAVEIQGPDEAKSVAWRERMRITRSAADASPAGLGGG